MAPFEVTPGGLGCVKQNVPFSILEATAHYKKDFVGSVLGYITKLCDTFFLLFLVVDVHTVDTCNVTHGDDEVGACGDEWVCATGWGEEGQS
jgi:hypothetical protein